MVSARAVTLGVAVLAAFPAGCGSSTPPRAAPPPRLPRALAASLAAQSDRVAQAMAGGDSCRAASLARALQSQTVAAINARRVPAAFQEPLTGSVNDLVSRIRCLPPQTPDDEHGRGKKKGHHKDEGAG